MTTTETKPGYKTTEFWVVLVGFVLGVFQEAVGVFNVSDARVTTLLTILASAYAVARGLAKAGVPAQVPQGDVK